MVCYSFSLNIFNIFALFYIFFFIFIVLIINIQDLKDLMRNAGEVTYADAHKKVRNEAYIFCLNSFINFFSVICFASHEDLRRALDRYQGLL